MLKKVHIDNRLYGVSLSRNAPVISHLFFADDNMVFACANVREAEFILDMILRKYESLSGQTTNLNKCEVSFSNCLQYI